MYTLPNPMENYKKLEVGTDGYIVELSHLYKYIRSIRKNGYISIDLPEHLIIDKNVIDQFFINAKVEDYGKGLTIFGGFVKDAAVFKSIYDEIMKIICDNGISEGLIHPQLMIETCVFENNMENLSLSQLEKILLPDNKPPKRRGRIKGVKNKNGYKKRGSAAPKTNEMEQTPVKANTEPPEGLNYDAAKLLAFVKNNCLREPGTPKQPIKRISISQETGKPFIRVKGEYSNQRPQSNFQPLSQTPKRW